MRRRKRQTSVFSLAFLDVMSCGFGAIVLIFLIVNNKTETQPYDSEESLAELRLLDFEKLKGQRELSELEKNARKTQTELNSAEAERSLLQNELRQLIEELENIKGSSVAEIEATAKLRSDVRNREEKLKQLQALERANEGNDLRVFEGEGDRQYLTGMKIGGRNIVIAVDTSASMLDNTVVNIIRRRNMSNEQKRVAPKWQRAIRTVEWLSAQLPLDADFQIYKFNEAVQTLTSDQTMQWQSMGDGSALNSAVSTLEKEVPSGGTNMEALILALRDLNPSPDSVYIVTDGLPTRDNLEPRRATVTSAQRLELFRDAANRLPRQIPINVILFPMEGDPMAGAAWWQLARATGGAFISPSWDWP